MKEKKDVNNELTPLTGGSVSLLGIKKYDAYNVISAFISAKDAQDKINEYTGNAAEIMFNMALAIEAENPAWSPTLVKKRFTSEFQDAVKVHISEGHMQVGWEKTFKKMDQAYRKIVGALEHDGILSELGSTWKCEKYRAAKEKEKKDLENETKEKEAIQELADSLGISFDEAKARLHIKPVNNTADSKQESKDGQVQPNESSVLQDNGFSKELSEFLTALGKELQEIEANNPDIATKTAAKIKNQVHSTLCNVLNASNDESKGSAFAKVS